MKSNAIRPLTLNDMDAAAEVLNLDLSEPTSGDELRRKFSAYSPDLPALRLGAWSPDGQMQGYATAVVFESPGGGIFFLRVVIRPEAQGHGLGRQLTDQLEDYCAQHPQVPTRKATFREGDVRAEQFVTARGFSLQQHLFESEVDLTTFDVAVLPPHDPGLEITTLAQLGMSEENIRHYHEVTNAADQDTPFGDEWGLASYENYVKDIIQASWFRPEGAFLGLIDGEWAGVHTVGVTSDPAVATTDFTGVVREFRGRNIGMSLKGAGLQYLKSQGCQKAITHNDSTNAPMLRINRFLGFVAQPGRMFYAKSNLS